MDIFKRQIFHLLVIDLLFEIFHYGIARVILFIIFVNLLIAKSILSTWIFEFDEVQSLLNNI